MTDVHCVVVHIGKKMILSTNEFIVGCIMSVTYVVLLCTCSGMLLNVYVKAAETEKNVAQAVMAGMSITLLSIMIPTLILYVYRKKTVGEASES